MSSSVSVSRISKWTCGPPELPVFPLRGKALEVAVDRRRPVGMRQVKRVAIAPSADRDARDEPRPWGVHRLSFHALRLQVDPAVEMVRAQFPAVSRQEERKVQRALPRLLRAHRRGASPKIC